MTFKEMIAARVKAKKAKATEVANAQLKALKNGDVSPESEGWEGLREKHAQNHYEVPGDINECGENGSKVILAFAKSARYNEGRGNWEQIPQILSDELGEKSLSKFVEKDFELREPKRGGMFAMPELLWNEFIHPLRASAPLLELGARVLTMKNGLIMPGMAEGHMAGYIGEKDSPAVTNTTFNDIKLEPKKLATKTCISFDLIEEGSQDVVSKIREDLIEVMGVKMSHQGIYGQRTQFAPGGLLEDKRIQTVDLGGNAWDSQTGLKGLRMLWDKKFKVSASDCGWLMNPALWESISGILSTTGQYIHAEEMNRGMHKGSPYSIYPDIPVASNETEAIFGLWREFIVGVTRELEVTTSNEAAFRNAAGDMVSAWDVEALLIKLTSKHDFAVRRPEAFIHFKRIGV